MVASAGVTRNLFGWCAESTDITCFPRWPCLLPVVANLTVDEWLRIRYTSATRPPLALVFTNSTPIIQGGMKGHLLLLLHYPGEDEFYCDIHVNWFSFFRSLLFVEQL